MTHLHRSQVLPVLGDLLLVCCLQFFYLLLMLRPKTLQLVAQRFLRTLRFTATEHPMMSRIIQSMFFAFLGQNQRSAGSGTDPLAIKSNPSLYSLYYAEACKELAGPISVQLHPGNTVPFDEMSHRWRDVGNTVSNLTCSRYKRVTARPTGWYTYNKKNK